MKQVHTIVKENSFEISTDMSLVVFLEMHCPLTLYQASLRFLHIWCFKVVIIHTKERKGKFSQHLNF